MKIAVVGPVCKDQNIVRGKVFPGTGGMTYYTGNALAALGANVTVYGYFGRKDLEIFNSFNCRLVHIPSEGTINFINEYHDGSDSRTQRARIFNNQVLPEHIDQHLSDSDLIILGPLFGNNITLELFEQISSIGKVTLSMQGIIRHQEGDKIILKRPETLERILPYVDYLIMDEDELKIVTQKNDIPFGIKYLKENGARNIFITQASRGSVISVEGKEYKIPAFPPNEL
jgi:sugar/nucleoside kinase (ribokinase family)